MIIRKIRLTEYEYQPPINFVAGATEPDIQFQLADYDIPAGATARCYVQRFDGTFEYTVATIDGNNVTVEPTSSMFSVRGEGAIQITLYAGEEVLKNFSVPVFVHADLADENAEQGSNVTGIFRAAEEQALEDFAEDAEAKAAEVIESIPEDYTELTEEVSELNERLESVEGEIGDLSQLETETKTDLVSAINEAAQSGGSVDPEVIAEAVDDWLDEHPEATTTVEDGSITFEKLATHVIDYITPEMYGAKGDATTDDTTALQNCIDDARTQNKPVRGFNRYKTTSPITISGNYQDIEIERITYTGNQSGIILTGSYNTLKMAQLYCGSGKGLVMQRSSSSASCSWNRITITRLFADGHAVDFDNNGQYFILYNTFDIRFIKSDTGNCYNVTGAVTENIYLNSTCSCPSGWAIYGGHGRFYNFTLESDVLNGIYDACGYFTGFRVREMVDKLVRRISGVQPDAQGGTLIKFVGNNDAPFMFNCDDYIPYDAIDVSEMATAEYIEEEYPNTPSEAIKLYAFKIINAPIRFGQWETENGHAMPGKGMLVAGGRRICIPAYETEWTITSASYDMRDAQTLLNHAKFYPTKMIIGVDNCVIHLSPSYCAYGYSEFIVDQSHGHLCTIYDCNSDVTPIFNGATLGSGVYRLKAYCNPVDNIIVRQGRYTTQYYNDTLNFSWDITRIDATGSGSCGVICVDDFGAVGDGVTDDSDAIQAAVDAGYDIYFSSNKTYYISTTIDIDHDAYLHGGENTVIRTETQSDEKLPNVFSAKGTLKKTTTLTTDYTTKGNTANSGNRFTLTDMTDISIGDVMVIVATDQYYNYSRAYYYLGATLLIGDIYDGHLYTTDSMPWDIENTEHVSVEIYDAPTVIFENLHFIADMESHGNYRSLIQMEECKNSVIRNCDFTQYDSGISLMKCVNTLIDCIQTSKSEEVELGGDSYSVAIYSCSNTIVERMMAISGQSGVSLSGTIPNMNTYVRNCNLGCESRNHGVSMHENTYNGVIEDCVLTGLNIQATAIVNRCRFVKNNRRDSDGGITLCGSHKPEYSRIRINDCTFESPNGVYIYNSSPQTPIQAYDNIIGLVEITGCTGGMLTFESRSSEYVLSNVIRELRISKWTDCYEIYHPNSDDIIEKLIVSDCTFSDRYWINDHHDNLAIDGIYDIDYRMTIPMMHKISANKPTSGEVYTLPPKAQISLSSENSSAQYVICGKNLAPNNPDDYYVGSVSGGTGDAPSRTISTGSGTATISNDANGNIVYTQKNNTSSYAMYPVGLFRVQSDCNIVMSAKIKNTGATSGATFRPYIIRIDGKTKLVVKRELGTAVEATAVGADISFTLSAKQGEIAMCYYYCSTPVANAETTFENMKAYCSDAFAPTPLTDDDVYEAVRRTGDGTLMSLPGVNNIMSSELDFDIQFQADYVANPIGALLNGTGVNF